MAEIYEGTIDGKPAKCIYYAEQQKTDIYWGGLEKPDGIGHNHATIVHAEATGPKFKAGPDSFHFLRINGKIIVDQAHQPDDKEQRRRMQRSAAGSLLGESFRKAWDYNMRNLRGGR